MSDILNIPLIKVRKIDLKRQKALKKMGIFTILDLLYYFPLRHNDFSVITPIKNLRPNTKATIKGKIQIIGNTKTTYKKINLTESLISDSTGTVKAVWFNQPYLVRSFKKGDKVFLNGKIIYSFSGLQMQNPVYEKAKSSQIHTGRLVPVYSVTGKLTSRWFRFIIKSYLKWADQIKDELPEQIKKRQNLIDLPEAVKQIHFPKNDIKLKQAQNRLVFDELFLLQLSAIFRKNKWQKNKAWPIKFNQVLIKKFVNRLPWKLTNAQRKAAFEILCDLEKERPMNRLLEGEVGSGKTVVAAIALLETAKAGYQGTLMAPTEILARQHFEKVSQLLKKNNLTVGLLTRTNHLSSDAKKLDRKNFLKRIALGKIKIIIGTHALIQKGIAFKNLALIVIDEQHRFGVKQRAYLKQNSSQKSNKNQNKAKKIPIPHFLTMTATPIPRTLALSAYGDLDLSIIDELPKNRQKVITKIISPEKRPGTYQFIEKEIKKGRQVYVVCPLISESDKLGVKSVMAEHLKLSEIFSSLKVEFLHGRLKKEEKEKIMKQLNLGKIDILVSTSVIEVGIDVPNVTIILIEGAERFGLAQLHQFRGRVGRGKHQSYCFLFTESNSEKTAKRLKALLESENGFELAEKDLLLRGPGELYGLKQSGLPDLKMASLMDYQTLKKARHEAEILLKQDPELKNCPLLKKKILKFNQGVLHLE